MAIEDLTVKEVREECKKRGWADAIFSFESNRAPYCRINAEYHGDLEAWGYCLAADTFRQCFAQADEKNKAMGKA